jgi:hypothetical protein
MSFVTVSISLNTAQLDKIAAGLDGNTNRVLGIIANDVLIGAIARAPVDTGALMNSLQTENPGRNSWNVHDGVEYGIFQELGTYKMAAHPFMIPSAWAAGNRLNSGALWSALFV